MLVRILRGPRFGQEVHLPKSQETQLAILLGDVEMCDSPADPVEQARRNPLPPSEGWSIVKTGLLNDVLAIRYDNGTGGVELYQTAPPRRRQWVFNPGDDEGRYELIPSSCPKEIVEQFFALGGGPRDSEAEFVAGDLKRQKLVRQQYEMDQQNRTAVRY